MNDKTKEQKRSKFIGSEPIRTVDGMDVHYRGAPGPLKLPGPFMPVLGCYDVPCRTGEFHWAAALGDVVLYDAVVPHVPVTRILFTDPKRSEDRWAYKAEWASYEERTDSLKRQCQDICDQAAASLEKELARILDGGVLVYEAAGRQPIEVWPHRSVKPNDQVGSVDLLIQTSIMAVRWL